MNSIENARYSFASRYFPTQDGSIGLYIDKSEQEGYETEIFMDVHLSHYPLRDWCGMWNEMKQIVTSYSKIGMRNKKAIEHNKFGKHMAHLLMSIRNGEFLDQNGQPDYEQVYEFLASVNEGVVLYENKE